MAAKIINVSYKVDSKELTKVKAEIQGIEKETKDSEKEMLKLNNTIKKTGDSGSQSFLNFKNILGAISVTAIIAGLTQLGRKILDLGVKQEQLNIAFTTFLGSATKAKTLLAELTKFAIVTPFTPDQVNSAAKALLAFGVQGKEIIPTLKMLGDVSAGTGKDLTEMAVIFGQIRSTGRLMGQDLLQLINAGFNPLQIISEKTGKSVATLKKEMEKGLISFEMVEGAFRTATSEGGLFFDLMEKQSVSIGGKLSTVAGNIEEVFKNIFNSTSGPLADFVDKLGTISEAFLLMSKSTEQLGQEIADIKLERFRNRLSQIEDQLKSNNKAIQDNAVTLQNSFAVDVVDAINSVSQELLELEGEFIKNKEDVSKAVSDGNKVAISETQKNTKELYLRKEALEAEKDGLIEVRDELFKLTKAEKSTGDEVKLTNQQLAKRAEALKKINEQIRKATGGQTRSEDEKDDQKKEQKRKDAIDREIEQDQRRAEVLKANNKDMEDEITRQLEEAADERIRIADEEAANREAAIQRTYDLAIELNAMLLENALMTREVDTQSIRDKYERELELAGDNDKAKDEIEKRREAELKRAEEKNKGIQKQNAIRKIGIDTAVAIIKTFAEFGYPAGIIPAALMGGIGIAQAAIVRKYKKGEVNIDGPGTSTSDSIPAMISRGESVINADATSKSSRLLEAINDRKIDDRILGRIAGDGGRQANGFDDSRIVDAINKNKVDYDTHGYTIMKGIQKGKNFKMFIRSKVQGY